MSGRTRRFSGLLGCVVLVCILLPAFSAAPMTMQPLVGQRSVTDWWPMFCHDPSHSGYSASVISKRVVMQWANRTVGFIESSPSIVDGKVYVTTSDFTHFEGYVYCFNLSSGSCQWSYDGHDEFFASPTVLDGRVFACSLNGNFFCLDAVTGAKIWSEKLGSHLLFEESSPAIVDGHIFMCSYKDDGSYNGSLFCLNAADGGVIWQVSPGNNRDYAPSVVDGRVYAAGLNNQLSCFDAADGDLVWMCPGVVLSTCPSVLNDSVFVGTQDGRICCVENGNVLWQYQAGSSYLVTNPPTFAYGQVYTGLYAPSIGTPDKVLCLNIVTGAEVWMHVLEEKGGVGYVPAVADGKLIILSSYMYDYPPNFDRIVNVHCYSAFSGEPLWNLTVGGGKDNYAYNSPGIANGKLVVCTTESTNSQVWGGVYCITSLGNTTPYVRIVKPENALYVHDTKVMPLRSPLIVGGIEIVVNATDDQSGMNRVELYLDGALVANDTEAPFVWNWTSRTPFHWAHTLKVIAFNNDGFSTAKEIAVRKFM